MLDITLLGRGGMAPQPGRHLTSLYIRHEGDAYLIDCGEGTQVSMKSFGLGFKQIRTIFFTHFHGDHIAGLPGLLLTMGNSDKTDSLTIVGPEGIQHVVNSLRVIAPELPFPIEFVELPVRKLPQPPRKIWSDGKNLSVHALPVPHNIPCFSYRIDLSRCGKFSVEKAKALKVPITCWSALQRGESVVVGNQVIAHNQVLGPERQGLRVCYGTDLRPTDELAAFAESSDLFICEGHYGDPAKQEKAIEYGHCMFTEAARMAADACARELWLTHFSPSVKDPEEWLPLAKNIFSETYIDRDQVTLSFR